MRAAPGYYLGLDSDVIASDHTVRRCMDAGLSLQEIIAELVRDKQRLCERLTELHAIAPFAVRQADGSIKVWRCPDDAVPMR